jgi:hypothetical protein
MIPTTAPASCCSQRAFNYRGGAGGFRGGGGGGGGAGELTNCLSDHYSTPRSIDHYSMPCIVQHVYTAYSCVHRTLPLCTVNALFSARCTL